MLFREDVNGNKTPKPTVWMLICISILLTAATFAGKLSDYTAAAAMIFVLCTSLVMLRCAQTAKPNRKAVR